MDLGFSGAGFMGCYYFGVIDCWNKYIPRERVNRVAGASAGSLIAAYYACDLNLATCLKRIIELSEDIRRRPLGVFDRTNQIVDVLPRVLDEILPEDAHKRCSGKLWIAITRLKDMKGYMVSEFETRKDLIDCLNCSCFIPFWSGNHVSTYKGVKHIDGGFKDNLPTFDEHTIKICCFSGKSDISPYDRAQVEMLSGTFQNMPFYLTLGNFRRLKKALFPPPSDAIVAMIERGYQDTKDFILSNDLIQCNSCYNKTDPRDQLIYSKISPSITPAVSPAISRANSFLDLNEIRSLEEAVLKESAKERAREEMEKSSVFLKPGGGIDKTSPKRSIFTKLLRDKLRNVSPTNSADEPSSPSIPTMTTTGDVSSQQDYNNNSSAPAIVIEEADSPTGQQVAPSSPDSSGVVSATTTSNIAVEFGPADSPSSDTENSFTGEQRPRKKVRPNTNGLSEKFLARRNTLQHGEQDLLVIKDKFTLAPNPLPSCPPSPNLNRHCTECIRMRQEARMDMLGEEIQNEIEKYRNVDPPLKESVLKSTFVGPLRWFRQLGVKTSYKFQDSPPATEVSQ